jgi:hypothetical protein
MDIIQDKTPSTDGSEINRSSNRTKKFPASRYSDFLMGNLNINNS